MRRSAEQDSPCPQQGRVGRGDSWWGVGPGGGNGCIQRQPWWRGGECTKPKLRWSREIVITKKIWESLPVGDYFYSKSKRQGSRKATLQTDEAACLCPEEAQSLALTTNFCCATSRRFLQIPLAPFPLCSEAFWALHSSPGTLHMSLWTTMQAFCTLTSIEVGRAAMGDLCSALKTQTAQNSKFLEPWF